MSRSKKKTRITENQFWQLVGLITLGRELRHQQDTIENTYRNIIKEDDDLTRYSDYVYEDRDIVQSLKKKLPYDNVIVVWKKKSSRHNRATVST